MRHNGRDDLLEHPQRLDLVPENAAPHGVEFEGGRIGLEHLLQAARTIAGGGGKILDPHRGDRGAGIGDFLIGEVLGKGGMHMHGAGDLERRAKRHAQGLDAGRIGKTETENGARFALGRKHLQRNLGHHRQRPPRAGKAAAEIVAGDVLHHPPPRSDGFAAPVDRLDAEHMVARRARTDAPGAGEIGGNDTPDRALSRSEAEHRAEIDRLEGKLLVVLGKKLLDFGERRPGADDKHKLARLVDGHADEILRAQHGAVLHRAADFALGAAPHHLDRRPRVGRLGDEVGKLLDIVGSVEADTHMPGHC